jgi:hypothetical protein
MTALLPADAQILGAGGYGLVVKNGPHALKLFYAGPGDPPANPLAEAEIQTKAAHILARAAGRVARVPAVKSVFAKPVVWAGSPFLNGITMEAVPSPRADGNQLHILLGYDGGDLDTLWLRSAAAPPGPANPPRGFFAGPDTLEELWEACGSRWTVKRVAALMGYTMGALIAGGVVPVDLEFVYGDDDEIWLIDFGLCRAGHVDPHTFLTARGSEGLAGELYIPQEGGWGHAEFLEGYYRGIRLYSDNIQYWTVNMDSLTATRDLYRLIVHWNKIPNVCTKIEACICAGAQFSNINTSHGPPLLRAISIKCDLEIIKLLAIYCPVDFSYKGFDHGGVYYCLSDESQIMENMRNLFDIDCVLYYSYMNELITMYHTAIGSSAVENKIIVELCVRGIIPSDYSIYIPNNEGFPTKLAYVEEVCKILNININDLTRVESYEVPYTMNDFDQLIEYEDDFNSELRLE